MVHEARLELARLSASGSKPELSTIPTSVRIEKYLKYDTYLQKRENVHQWFH